MGKPKYESLTPTSLSTAWAALINAKHLTDEEAWTAFVAFKKEKKHGLSLRRDNGVLRTGGTRG